MAWCRQATSHYLNQCWPRSLSPYGLKISKDLIRHFEQCRLILQNFRNHWGTDTRETLNKTNPWLDSRPFACWWPSTIRCKAISSQSDDQVFFSNTYGTTAIILCMGLVNERWRYNKVVSHWLTYTEWSPEPSLQALITKSRRGIHNVLSVFLHHPFDSLSLVSKSLLKFYALINCPS